MIERTKPADVLFIMTDQHRFDFLSCAGASFVRTPNIDRIAARGMRFTHCVTNAPICVPARIGLASGLQPCRLGSVDNFSYLPLSAPTFYQHFRNHGYRMGCIGKLDLAKPTSYNGRYGDRSCAYGWGFTDVEEVEGKMHSGRFPEPQGPYGFYLREKGRYDAFHEQYKFIGHKDDWATSIGMTDDSVLSAEDFQDAYIGSRSAAWIRNTPDDYPRHFFVSFAGPHDPYDPPSEYAERYRGAPMPEPIPVEAAGKPAWIARKQNRYDREQIDQARRQYCAAIELIDDQVGLILDALEARGKLDDTYIIFTSDHGDMLGDHGLFQKSVPYEASIRVPLLVAGPGIPAGSVSDALVELIDLNPTVSELAGLPSQPNMDARSFADVLRSEEVHHREHTVSRLENFKCIRTRKYKYVDNMNDIKELYDLEKDPCETANIAQSEPELVKKLHRTLQGRYMEGKWLY